MKKLLNLLLASGLVTSSASASILMQISKNDENWSVIHKKLSDSDVSNSSYLAGALIIRHDDNYSYASTINVKSDDSAGIVNSWHNTFGSSYVDNDFISRGSKINYQSNDDKTLTDNNSVIDNFKINGSNVSVDELVSLLKSAINSQGNATDWINGLLGGNLIPFVNSIGKILDGILGKNNLVSKIVDLFLSDSSIAKGIINILSSGSMDSFNSKFGNKNYTSAFDVASNDLATALKDFHYSNKLSDDDMQKLTDYILLVTNYISQFNFNSEGKIGEHLFDPNKTNSDYLEGINNETIQKMTSVIDIINTTNLSNFINNLLNYNENNGLGIAQLLYVFTGDSNNLSKDNPSDNEGNIMDLKIVPTSGNKNPLNKSLSVGFNFAIASLLSNAKIMDFNAAYEIAADYKIGGQLLGAVSSLISNTVENKQINIPLDYLDEITFLGTQINKINISVTDSGNSVLRAGLSLFSNIKDNSLNPSDIAKKCKEIQDSILKIRIQDAEKLTTGDDDFSSSMGTVKYFENVSNIDQKGLSLWNNIWTGDYSTTPEIPNIINIIFNKVVTIPSVKDIISQVMSSKIFGVSVYNFISSINKILPTFEKYKSEIEKGLPMIGDSIKELYSSLTNEDQLNNAKGIFNTLVTDKGKSDSEVMNLIDSTPSELSYISALSIAFAKNEVNNNMLKQNNWTINNSVLNILYGTKLYTPLTTVNTGSVGSILNNWYGQLKQFINSDAFAKIWKGFQELERKPFKDALSNVQIFISPDITPILENGKYEYEYKLNYTDFKTQKTSSYKVILDEQNPNDSNEIYYKMKIVDWQE